MSIWIWIEHSDGIVVTPSREALSIGRRIADETGFDLTAIVFGDHASAAAEETIKHGAEKVIISEDETLTTPNLEKCAEALGVLAAARQPRVILAGGTTFSTDVMAACAVDLSAGLISDFIGFEVIDGIVETTLPIYSGNLLAKASVPHGIQILTPRAGVFPPDAIDEGRSGEIEVAEIPLTEDQPEVMIDHFEASGDEVSLAEADIIVAGGSVCGPEGFDLIGDLANALGGAVGASRPPVDLGMMPFEHQVGQTGRVVSPELYFAVGISGAMWHLAGMRTSKVIVAINNDREAPIFSMADFGIIGDLFEIVPALTAAVSEKLG